MGTELAIVKVSQSPFHVLIAGEFHHSRAIMIYVSVDYIPSLPEMILPEREVKHSWHGNSQQSGTIIAIKRSCYEKRETWQRR